MNCSKRPTYEQIVLATRNVLYLFALATPISKENTNTNPFSPRSTVNLVRACANAFRINEKVSIISGRTERSPHHLSTPKARCFSIIHLKSRQQRCAYLIRLEQQKYPMTSLCYSLTVLYPYTLLSTDARHDKLYLPARNSQGIIRVPSRTI